MRHESVRHTRDDHSLVLQRLRDTDPVRHRHEIQRARSLLFVAATRARDSVDVFWHGKPSPFLDESWVDTPESAS